MRCLSRGEGRLARVRIRPSFRGVQMAVLWCEAGSALVQGQRLPKEVDGFNVPGIRET
jgi:hypothetical protein